MNATGTQTKISLQNILYATDFSPAAEAALPYVLGLAKQYGATVPRNPRPISGTLPDRGTKRLPQIMEAAELQAKFESAAIARNACKTVFA